MSSETYIADHAKIVSVLCVAPRSNYNLLPPSVVDLWPQERDAYNYKGTNKVIAHPPCAQHSKLFRFSKANQKEKDLAAYCFEIVNRNGGILEHPVGSSFMKSVDTSKGKLISINQSWFGFPARKNTLLYFSQVNPLSYPLSFDRPLRTVSSLHSAHRSIMPLSFCKWLVECCSASFTT